MNNRVDKIEQMQKKYAGFSKRLDELGKQMNHIDNQ